MNEEKKLQEDLQNPVQARYMLQYDAKENIGAVFQYLAEIQEQGRLIIQYENSILNLMTAEFIPPPDGLEQKLNACEYLIQAERDSYEKRIED